MAASGGSIVIKQRRRALSSGVGGGQGGMEGETLALSPPFEPGGGLQVRVEMGWKRGDEYSFTFF